MDDSRGPEGPESDATIEIDTGKLDEGQTTVLESGDSGAQHRTITRRTARQTTTFDTGDLIAERYTVCRFLAQGGMGEVYEVEDKELGERVALKTVLPHVAEDPVAMERFRREILVARRVTHSNVCRIFDIGRHEGDEDDNEKSGVTFLTMELLEGETLGDRITRGRMTTEEALPLAEQMAEGLAAAHATGIVHRDLKPANIFLVPDGDGVRAVVTDFGLARPGGGHDGEMDVTGTGEVIGTPAYMAPEQVQGQDSTTATDVYAFGLILYEMLTGARAFEGETAFQIALRRLQQAPTAPSVHIPEIEPIWEKTIMSCLERDPNDRIQNALDVARALKGEKVRVGTRSKTKRWVAAGVLAAVLLGGGYGLHRMGLLGGAPESPAESMPVIRQSAAVLGFHNVSGDPEHDWVSTAIGEVLTTELGSGKGLRTVPGETVTRFLLDAAIDGTQSTLGEETLARLRSNLAVDFAVLGSYIMVPGGSDIRLDVRVQNAVDGSVVAARGMDGTSAEILSLVQLMADGLRTDLELASATQIDLASAALPGNPGAARAYVEGVDLLRRFDPQGALAKLQEAAEIEPDSAVVHEALTNAWEDLGYDGRALEAARRASDLSQGLPQEQRLRAQAQFAAADRRWTDAVDAYRTLWTFFPDNPAYGLALAGVQVAAGTPAAAIQTVEELRRLPGPTSEDPRIDLMEAEAARTEGRYQAQLEAARRAEETGRRLGAGQLVARALGQETSAYIELGQPENARSATEEAQQLWQTAGDEAGMAQAIQQLGIIAYNEQKFAEAEQLFKKSLEIRQGLGQRRGAAECHNTIGGVRIALGDAVGAEESFSRALEIYRDTENLSEQARVLANLAVLQQRKGQLTEAIDMLEQVRLLYQRVGNHAAEAATLGNIAATYFARGDLKGARKAYESAVAIERETDQAALLSRTLFSLGEVLTHLGELEEARRRHEESAQIADESGNQMLAAVAGHGMAGVVLERAILGEASLATAEGELETALAALQTNEIQDSAALALVQLATVRDWVGDSTGAAEAIKEARALADALADLGLSVSVLIGEARLKGAEPEKADELRAVLQQVKDAGVLGLVYEIELALAEIELRDQSTRQQGIDRLNDLSRDSSVRGWLLTSRKAAAYLERF